MALRVTIALTLSLLFWGFGSYFLGLTLTPKDRGAAFATLVWFILMCPIWFILVALPFINWVGEKVGSFWWPSDEGFEWQPQYSIAEARVKEGLYGQAIQEYRKYIELYPQEVTPHLRIADLQLIYFKKTTEALEELKVAVSKAKGAEGFSLLNFRLADIYWNHQKNWDAAMECLRDVQRRYPNTKQAKAALERAEKLVKKKFPDSFDLESS